MTPGCVKLVIHTNWGSNVKPTCPFCSADGCSTCEIKSEHSQKSFLQILMFKHREGGSQAAMGEGRNNPSVDWGPPGTDLAEADPADLDTQRCQLRYSSSEKYQSLLGPSGSRRL